MSCGVVSLQCVTSGNICLILCWNGGQPSPPAFTSFPCWCCKGWGSGCRQCRGAARSKLCARLLRPLPCCLLRRSRGFLALLKFGQRLYVRLWPCCAWYSWGTDIACWLSSPAIKLCSWSALSSACRDRKWLHMAFWNKNKMRPSS